MPNGPLDPLHFEIVRGTLLKLEQRGLEIFIEGVSVSWKEGGKNVKLSN